MTQQRASEPDPEGEHAPGRGDAPEAAAALSPPETPMWRRPEVQTLVISRAATGIGIATLMYGAMVWLASTGASQLAISFTSMTRYGAALVFGVAAGSIADLTAKRTALFSSYAIQAACCFLIPTFFGTSLPSLLLLLLIVAVLGQITAPAIMAATALVARKSEMAAVAAIISVAGGIGTAVGSAFLAPLLIRSFGIRGVMYTAGVILLFGATRGLKLPDEAGKAKFRAALRQVEWRESVPSLEKTAHWLGDNRAVGSILLVGSIVLALFDGMNTLMPVYVRDVLHSDPTNMVYIFAPGAVGFMLASILGPILMGRFGERPVAVLSLGLMTVGMISFGFVYQLTPIIAPLSPLQIVSLVGTEVPPLIAAAGFLAIPTALGSTLAATAVQTYINRRVPLERQGSTFGLQAVIDNGLTLTTILLLGLAASLLGSRVVFAIAPLVVLGVAVWLVRYSVGQQGDEPITSRQALQALLEYKDDPDAEPAG